MSVKIVAFFNNKGGVGKTSLVYHLAWMFASLGERVVAVDLDPQANLTSAFLSEDRIEELWQSAPRPTMAGWVKPLKDGIGDVSDPVLEPIDDSLALLPGDLELSRFEDELSSQWPRCLSDEPRAFRVISSFWRIMQKAADAQRAGLVLVDLGPNLGALNRAVLISADYVVFPLAPDLFSLLGLQNLGPTLRTWKSEWSDRRVRNSDATIPLPPGAMQPAGYVLLQHSIRYDRPTRAYERWMNKIPGVYAKSILDKTPDASVTIDTDENALALLKHYRTLMPLAQEARKPIFRLTAADGASGAHYTAAQKAGDDFRCLARRLAERIGLELSDPLSAVGD